jgi:homospermidine synthase
MNGQANMAKFHPEDRRCLCHFHPCNDILMRLYEIFKAGKKQDLRPFMHLHFLENKLVPIEKRLFFC